VLRPAPVNYFRGGSRLNLRRALGFKLAFPGHVLPQFVTYLEAAGASTVTVELAIAWAGLPAGVQPISLAHRLGAVRGHDGLQPTQHTVVWNLPP
jgi:hypothetical protein